MHGSSWTYRTSVLLILITTDIILVKRTTQNNGLVERLSYHSYSKNLYLKVRRCSSGSYGKISSKTIYNLNGLPCSRKRSAERRAISVYRYQGLLNGLENNVIYPTLSEARSVTEAARTTTEQEIITCPSKYVPTEWNRPVVFLTEICMFYNFDERGA